LTASRHWPINTGPTQEVSSFFASFSLKMAMGKMGDEENGVISGLEHGSR
jgi:hypothetical protein